jgi:hypothetical protein
MFILTIFLSINLNSSSYSIPVIKKASNSISKVNNMKYLMEREVAFDENKLGFPSIMGCHAIVYQTINGIYGFHVAGSSGNNQWKANADCFSQFIQILGGLTQPGSRLYGVTFIGNNQRGYAAPPKQSWKEELITFANALNYRGKISGYDLFRTLGSNVSAYVEFNVNGSKCDLYIRKWLGDNDPGGPEDTNREKNPPDNKKIHKMILKKGFDATLVELENVVSSVSRGNLVQVSKERLR